MMMMKQLFFLPLLLGSAGIRKAPSNQLDRPGSKYSQLANLLLACSACIPYAYRYIRIGIYNYVLSTRTSSSYTKPYSSFPSLLLYYNIYAIPFCFIVSILLLYLIQPGQDRLAYEVQSSKNVPLPPSFVTSCLFFKNNRSEQVKDFWLKDEG